VSEEVEKPQFGYYEPHPYLSLFPLASAGAILRMEKDVAAVGVVEPLTCWRDSRGREFVIDGRTRQLGAKAAFEKKVEAREVPEAANGLPLQPAVDWFNGSDGDVWEFIKRKNIRKDYTPGQRAAYGIRVYYQELKWRHKLKELPDVRQEAELEGALDSKELGVLFDCNEYFARIARALYREAPDLLDAMAADVAVPKKLMAQLASRRLGTAPGAPGEEGEGEEKVDNEKVRDGTGQDVPEDMYEVFRTRSSVRVVKRMISQAVKSVEAIAASAGGEFFDLEALSRKLGSIARDLENAAPYQMCADCKNIDGRSTGRTPGHRPCKTCNGKKFVCKAAVVAAKKKAGAPAPATAAP